ncbi:MAG: glycoside hydrolase family 3 N-terminal domain-containing protein [Bacteroidota bacterium]
MEKKYLILFVVMLFVSGFKFSEDSKPQNEDLEKKIDKILSSMTLEEKVGQMTQVTLEVVSKERKSESDELVLDIGKLKDAILKYKVGSILNTGGAANSIESWHNIITTIQDIALKESRLKIPVLYGIDAIHGANFTIGATLFPQAIAMSATRNKDIVFKGGEITAFETRASGIPWNFNPVLGMGREPLWPRLWETYGEDVYLTTEMGRAYVKGQQGNDIGAKDKVATCIKHYLGYSVPKNGNDRTPAWIPERMMREIFLPSFQAGVEEGSMTVMVNSSEINGIPVHADHYLLTELLKDELNFKGFIVSDWEDIKRLHTRDRVAETPEQAVKMAVMAGLDMSMVPYDYSFYEILLKLVDDGEVPVSRIDDAVRRILRVKLMVGLFENPYPNKELVQKFACNEFTQANLDAAREAITLLKNNSKLPLKKNSKVLVTGPTSNLMRVLNGGWTFNWQGDNESLYPAEKFTILEAVQNKIGKDNVLFYEGVDFSGDVNSSAAVDAASSVDAVILCLGESNYSESPGNITDLALDVRQIEYAKKLYKTGIPVILVLIEGRPRVINPIVEDASAIVMGYLPGMEGGIAISDVLFGDVNPSGKLPFTYPKFVNGNTTYDYKPIEFFDVNKYDPQFPFGFGLSYTSFSYSDLKLEKTEIEQNENLKISVKVTNSGSVDGKEAVELYLTDIYGSVTRPNKQLKRFEKIELKTGESKVVEFSLNTHDLSFIGRDNKRITEAGEFIVSVSDLKKNFFLK